MADMTEVTALVMLIILAIVAANMARHLFLSRRRACCLSCRRRRPTASLDAAEIEEKRQLRAAERELVEQWNVATARQMAKAGLGACCLLCAIVLSQIAIGFRVMLTMGISFLGACVLFLVMGVYPQAVMRKSTLMWWHVSVMVFLSLYCFAESITDNERSSANAANSLTCIMIGLLCLRLPVLIITNIGFTICSCTAIVIRSSEPTSSTTRFQVAVELIELGWRIGLFWCIENLRWAHARSEIMARFKKTQEFAASSLLNLVCDVVVDLGENLCLKTHSAKLACMLMHSGGRSLQGTQLIEFMPDKDEQERYCTMLAQAQKDDEHMPNMATLRLRDSLGTFLKVAAFHVPYMSLDGQTHHLIGLQEENDGHRAGAGSFEARIQKRTKAAACEDEGTSAGGIGPLMRSQGSGRSSRSSRSRSSSGGSRRHKGPKIDVYLTDGLPTKEVSKDLKEKLGIKEGDQLGQYMVDGATALEGFMQTVMNEAFYKKVNGSFESHFGDVAFKNINADSSAEPHIYDAVVYFPSPLTPGSGMDPRITLRLAALGGESKEDKPKSYRKGTAPKGTHEELPGGSSASKRSNGRIASL